MVFDGLPGAPRSLWLDGPEAAGLAAPPLTADLETAKQAQELDREATAATRAGLDVRRTDTLDLPFPIAGALVREEQAELQIASNVMALAEALRAAGGQIFEGTVATHVGEGSRPTVRTAGGAQVRARDVVVATHYPILDRGLFFPRLTPKRSYCLAVRIPAPLPDIMAISIGSPTRSLRAAPDPGRPGEELLILGGEGHTAGEDGDRTPERYQALWSFAQEHFDATEATHRWSAQRTPSRRRPPQITGWRDRRPPRARRRWATAQARR
jgi:hypothetical protein